jgi:hypothetical protein
VLSVILGIVLRTLGPDHETDYDSDDDVIVPARLPLLRNQCTQHAPDYLETNLARRNPSWEVQISDKVRCFVASASFSSLLHSQPIHLTSLNPCNIFLSGQQLRFYCYHIYNTNPSEGVLLQGFGQPERSFILFVDGRMIPTIYW